MSEQSEILCQELKRLQAEAEKILDEIDAKEAEILQIEEDEDREAAIELNRMLNETLEEMKSKFSLVDEFYIDDQSEDVLYLRYRKDGKKLAAIDYRKSTIEEFEEWVHLQVESMPFYLEIIHDLYDDLISAEVNQPIIINLTHNQHLTLEYQLDPESVKINHHKSITYDQIESMLSAAYGDQKFKKSGIVDSYEIIFTSSTETTCDLMDLVETIKQIKSEVKQNLS